jgi:fumarylacetoacetase
MLVYDLLRHDNPRLRDDGELCRQALRDVESVEMMLPTEIPQFVDFYAGIHHASNVGRMFRPDQPPLLPNYRHIPIGYNGRASSVIPSEVPIQRPNGQTKSVEDPLPRFGPTGELDFELELGFFVAQGNDMGTPISIEEADQHILGYVLVNDWSARDMQRWEYQPLGPFLAKSFATSISPWIVMSEALAAFRVPGEPQEPEPLEYLRSGQPGHLDIKLEVSIQSAKMTRPQVITQSNARHLYWTCAQLLTHLTSNGTNVEPGDLVATGTISGPDEGTFGSLLELTWRGARPIVLEETGEERTFLQDGDTVIMSGYAQGDGYRVGFGELRTTVLG